MANLLLEEQPAPTDRPAPTEHSVDAEIVFPQGLVGCESWKRFRLVTDDEADLPIGVLQSLDDEAVSLMVTTPECVVADYRVNLSAEDRALLGLGEEQVATIYCTLNVGADGWLTANLLGPLVVNPATRRGKQVVLVDTPFSTRHPVAQIDG